MLGLVQGVTEFLPVSSSGHLVLVEHGLGVRSNGQALEIAVHLGTLLAVLLHYRRDLVDIVRDVLRRSPGARLGWMVVVGTLPAVVVGLAFKHQIDAAFGSPRAAAWGLVATGVVLLLTPLARRRESAPGMLYAFVVGCAQAVAILPGVSRSGSTIGTALFLGDDAVRAARFSFLLSIPAIGGAAVLLFADGALRQVDAPGPLLLAACVAFVSGWAAIAFLIRLLGRGRLWCFGPYCLALGAWVLHHLATTPQPA